MGRITKNKKAICIPAVIILVSIIFFIFITEKGKTANLKANLTIKNATEIRPVFDEDMTKVKLSDYKVIDISIVGKTDFYHKYRSVTFDSLGDLFSERPGIKIVGGSCADNPEILSCNTGILIYAPKFSEKDINKMLKNYKVMVTWDNIWGKRFFKMIDLN